MRAESEETTRLEALVDRSPLLPDPELRKHWRRVLAWLPPAARYELAEILELWIEDECRD